MLKLRLLVIAGFVLCISNVGLKAQDEDKLLQLKMEIEKKQNESMDLQKKYHDLKTENLIINQTRSRVQKELEQAKRQLEEARYRMDQTLTIQDFAKKKIVEIQKEIESKQSGDRLLQMLRKNLEMQQVYRDRQLSELKKLQVNGAVSSQEIHKAQADGSMALVEAYSKMEQRKQAVAKEAGVSQLEELKNRTIQAELEQLQHQIELRMMQERLNSVSKNDNKKQATEIIDTLKLVEKDLSLVEREKVDLINALEKIQLDKILTAQDREAKARAMQLQDREAKSNAERQRNRDKLSAKRDTGNANLVKVNVMLQQQLAEAMVVIDKLKAEIAEMKKKK